MRRPTRTLGPLWQGSDSSCSARCSPAQASRTTRGWCGPCMQASASAGTIEHTQVFPERTRLATDDLESLEHRAREMQAMAAAAVSASTDESLDEEVYSSTLEEVQRGWLRGPFTPDELDARHGWWIPARRFGIK